MLSFIWSLDDFETSCDDHIFLNPRVLLHMLLYYFRNATNLLYLRKRLYRNISIWYAADINTISNYDKSNPDNGLSVHVRPKYFFEGAGHCLWRRRIERVIINLFCFAGWQMFSFDHLSGEQKPLGLAWVNHWPIHLAKWRILQLERGESEGIPVLNSFICVYFQPFPFVRSKFGWFWDQGNMLRVELFRVRFALRKRHAVLVNGTFV